MGEIALKHPRPPGGGGGEIERSTLGHNNDLFEPGQATSHDLSRVGFSREINFSTHPPTAAERFDCLFIWCAVAGQRGFHLECRAWEVENFRFRTFGEAHQNILNHADRFKCCVSLNLFIQI